jgi:hypothetical protein
MREYGKYAISVSNRWIWIFHIWVVSADVRRNAYACWRTGRSTEQLPESNGPGVGITYWHFCYYLCTFVITYA